MRRHVALLLLAASAPLFADGGAVLLHQQTGPYVVTFFASPTPPRAGMVDLSVLVQSAATLDPVLDSDVHISLAKSGPPVDIHATRSQANNKLLYAASAPLRDPGLWRYSVTISRQAADPIVISGSLTVNPEQPKLAAYAAYLALPFLALAILALHQWLRFRKVPRPIHQQIRIC